MTFEVMSLAGLVHFGVRRQSEAATAFWMGFDLLRVLTLGEVIQTLGVVILSGVAVTTSRDSAAALQII